MSDKQIYLIGHIQTEPWTGGQIQKRLELFTKFYKIGVAKDVRSRLSGLQTGTPHKLELVTTVESNDAEAVESTLHRIYRIGNYTGEWFRLDANAINSLKALDGIDSTNIQNVERKRRSGVFDWKNGLYVNLMKERDRNSRRRDE